MIDAAALPEKVPQIRVAPYCSTARPTEPSADPINQCRVGMRRGAAAAYRKANSPNPTASDTAPLPDVPDGDPTRLPCTSNFGDALTSTHGRLDGILVAIVPPGESQCNGDDDHLHLQVRADDQIYDVAVNVRSDLGGDPDVHYFTTPAQLTGPAWAEGWHPDLKLDYPASLGVHDDDFTPYTINVLAQKVEGALSTANHVSIYGTGYGPDGMHKIHRDGYGRDGAIVLEPLSGDARYLLFRFASQTF